MVYELSYFNRLKSDEPVMVWIVFGFNSQAVLALSNGTSAEEDLKTDLTKAQLKDEKSPTGNMDLSLQQVNNR
ncbi:UNVERIFIED_CONTAM: hypothetical protein NCL1_43577 [Trichonephila clavipes]